MPDLIRCAGARAQASGCSGPSVGGLPWVEGRVPQLARVEHCAVQRGLRSRKGHGQVKPRQMNVNKLVRPSSVFHNVSVGSETHVGGCAKHRKVEGGLLETGLGGMGP